MSKTFEFNGVVLTKKLQKSRSCDGCYFRKQPVHHCDEQQKCGIVPMCYDAYKSYIFIEVKDTK